MSGAVELAGRLAPFARGLTFARPRLRAFYDDWLRGRGLPHGPAGFVHAVVATAERGAAGPDPLDPARDGDALALALAALGPPEHAVAFFGAAAGAGLFDPPATHGRGVAEARARLAREAADLVGGDVARTALQAGGLEAMTEAGGFFPDPGYVVPAVLLARRRLCKVTARDELGRPRTGSGFLIGPSAVLTNRHVVEAPPGRLVRASDIEVRFDYSDTTGLADAAGARFAAAADWCLASSPSGEVDASGTPWWHDRDRRERWLEAVRGSHDYAVIRLDGAPGLQRGWVALDEVAREEDDALEGLIVLHHPGNYGQTMTMGGVVLTPRGSPRIFHLASTHFGSSGGLALDQQGRPVGLHYLGARSEVDPPAGSRLPKAINAAIPLADIAADLKAKGVLARIAEAPGIRPHRGCLDGRTPVFGREQLLKDLVTVWSGERPVLMVHVEARDPPLVQPGKSFTAEIVRGLFRAPENHHIVFAAGKLKADALGVARDTLRTFAEDLVPTLPTVPDTTTPAYVGRLVTALGQAIAERLGNRRVWVMLDDLDRHDLSDASGRELLTTLYDRIGRLPNVRVVLIGLPRDAAISGLDEAKVLRTDLTGADLDRLGERFTAWLRERGGRDAPFTEESYRFLAEIAVSLAGARRPLRGLAAFATDHVARAADVHFGGAAGPAAPLGMVAVPAAGGGGG